MAEIDPVVREYLAELGRKGGQARARRYMTQTTEEERKALSAALHERKAAKKKARMARASLGPSETQDASPGPEEPSK